MEKLRILIVGLGSIGQRHAKLLRDEFSCDVIALREHRENKASLNDVREVYSWDEARAARPDAAFVTNPTSMANHNPVRPRKLLLNKSEIRKIQGAVEAGGRTLVPTRMYLKHGLVKVEIGVCTGKKLHDKRETLKKRTEMREAEVAMRSRG